MSYIPPRRPRFLEAELKRIRAIQERTEALGQPEEPVDSHISSPDPDFPAAVHEAGHAIVAQALSLPIGRVGLDGSGDCAARMQISRPEPVALQQEGAERYAVSLYAGWAAESVILGTANERYGADFDSARRWIAENIQVPGCRQVGDHAFEVFERRLQQRAVNIVRLKRSEVEQFAAQLLADRGRDGGPDDAAV